MSGFWLWPRAEHHWVFRKIKEDVKVATQPGKFTILTDPQVELGTELGVVDAAGVEVQVKDSDVVGDHHPARDDLDTGLLKDGLPHAIHLEAVHFGPEFANIGIVSLMVRHSANIKSAPVKRKITWTLI